MNSIYTLLNNKKKILKYGKSICNASNTNTKLVYDLDDTSANNIPCIYSSNDLSSKTVQIKNAIVIKLNSLLAADELSTLNSSLNIMYGITYRDTLTAPGPKYDDLETDILRVNVKENNNGEYDVNNENYESVLKNINSSKDISIETLKLTPIINIQNNTLNARVISADYANILTDTVTKSLSFNYLNIKNSALEIGTISNTELTLAADNANIKTINSSLLNITSRHI